MQKILKLHHLHPDGIKIVVPWEGIKVSMSVFIPCVDTEKCAHQIKEIAARNKWEVKTATVVEKDKLGVRFWRTL